MRLSTGFSLGILVAAGVAGLQVGEADAAGEMSHAHMGHVMKAWKDTPGGRGLMATAFVEAEIANKHAGFAAKKPKDLKWMKTHIEHVMNAIDPSVQAKGPGMGYGVIKAAGGAAKHINLAAKSKGASNNVRIHAVHVATSSNNTVLRAKEIIVLGNKVLDSKKAGTAFELVKQIAVLTGELIGGRDANGDGAISWHKDEGGLNEVKKHMDIMAKGEDLN
jgi:hypothetical protein